MTGPRDGDDGGGGGGGGRRPAAQEPLGSDRPRQVQKGLVLTTAARGWSVPDRRVAAELLQPVPPRGSATVAACSSSCACRSSSAYGSGPALLLL